MQSWKIVCSSLFIKVQLSFYQFKKWLYVFIVMNKDLLMLCITYYGRLEILLIQSSTSQICVIADPDSYRGYTFLTPPLYRLPGNFRFVTLPFQAFTSDTPLWKFGNSLVKNQDLWKFYMNFSWSLLEISLFFNWPQEFPHALPSIYPWKFRALPLPGSLPPPLFGFFFWNSPFQGSKD